MTGEATYHSVSVAGVVIDENGRTLVIQRRDNGHWEPPGGVLEREESIIEGLLREVREETGLIVEPVVLTSGIQLQAGDQRFSCVQRAELAV
ncbi:MAG TPA: NUDIX domain-containing protein [Streptosporangiaceae bacterium]|nr:NUDIX domain-containing protein [Streptosporangiaceae bacterium]